jgi:hypothetical protein
MHLTSGAILADSLRPWFILRLNSAALHCLSFLVQNMNYLWSLTRKQKVAKREESSEKFSHNSNLLLNLAYLGISRPIFHQLPFHPPNPPAQLLPTSWIRFQVEATPPERIVEIGHGWSWYISVEFCLVGVNLYESIAQIWQLLDQL